MQSEDESNCCDDVSICCNVEFSVSVLYGIARYIILCMQRRLKGKMFSTVAFRMTCSWIRLRYAIMNFNVVVDEAQHVNERICACNAMTRTPTISLSHGGCHSLSHT